MEQDPPVFVIDSDSDASEFDDSDVEILATERLCEPSDKNAHDDGLEHDRKMGCDCSDCTCRPDVQGVQKEECSDPALDSTNPQRPVQESALGPEAEPCPGSSKQNILSPGSQCPECGREMDSTWSLSEDAKLQMGTCRVCLRPLDPSVWNGKVPSDRSQTRLRSYTDKLNMLMENVEISKPPPTSFLVSNDIFSVYSDSEDEEEDSQKGGVNSCSLTGTSSLDDIVAANPKEEKDDPNDINVLGRQDEKANYIKELRQSVDQVTAVDRFLDLSPVVAHNLSSESEALYDSGPSTSKEIQENHFNPKKKLKVSHHVSVNKSPDVYIDLDELPDLDDKIIVRERTDDIMAVKQETNDDVIILSDSEDDVAENVSTFKNLPNVEPVKTEKSDLDRHFLDALPRGITETIRKHKMKTGQANKGNRLTYSRFNAMKKAERAALIKKNLEENQKKEEECEANCQVEPISAWGVPYPALYTPYLFPWKVPLPESIQTKADLSEAHCSMVLTYKDHVESMLKTGVQTLQSFVTFRHKPTVEVLRNIIEAIRQCTNVKLVQMAVNGLKHLHEIHHDLLPFTYKDIETVIDELILPFSNSFDSDKICKLILLDYMITVLKCELPQTSSVASQRQIWRCPSVQWLRADRNFSKCKQLVHWISTAVGHGQLDEHSGTLFGLRLSPPVLSRKRKHQNPDDLAPEDLPKLLPMLQSLLDLAIVTSPKPEEDAQRIAAEMAAIYIRLPNFHHRKCVLDTIISPVLKFFTSHRILEDHCPGNGPSSSDSLSDLVESHFQREPLHNASTPPPTPEEDRDGDEVARAASHKKEACLELAMLICNCLEGYLQYARGKLHQPLPKRAQSQPDTLSLDNMLTLPTLKERVGSLRQWLQSLCPETSEGGIVYYTSRLETLSDMAGL